MKLRKLLLFLPVVPFLWTACSTTAEKAGLGVNLVNLRLAEATVLETTACFTVRFINETPDPLTVSGGVFKIYLEGSYVGEGVMSDTLRVERFSSVTGEVKSYLRNLTMARRLRGIIERQGAGYRVRGTIYLQEGSRRVRVAQEGALELKDFQPQRTPAAPQ